MKCCRRWPFRPHVAYHFALTIVQISQLFALQQLNIAVQNGERSFQIVSRGSQRIVRPQKALLELVMLLLQLSTSGILACFLTTAFSRRQAGFRFCGSSFRT